MDIEGSVAFVTGANRGIGKAFVEGLLDAGVAKVYAASRVREALDEITRLHPGRIVPIALDVTDSTAVHNAAKYAGDINLLINNAGVAHFEGFNSADNLAAARTEMDVNYFGSLEMIRAFAPILRASGGGAIVQVSSIAGMVTFPVVGSYSASKAAVNAMIQGVRAELAPQGTAVMGVYPGVVDTGMSDRFDAPGVPPEDIVNATLEAVIMGYEDVFPDAMSQDLYKQVLSDPKGVEQQFSRMLPVTRSGDQPDDGCERTAG